MHLHVHIRKYGVNSALGFLHRCHEHMTFSQEEALFMSYVFFVQDGERTLALLLLWSLSWVAHIPQICSNPSTFLLRFWCVFVLFCCGVTLSFLRHISPHSNLSYTVSGIAYTFYEYHIFFLLLFCNLLLFFYDSAKTLKCFIAVASLQ